MIARSVRRGTICDDARQVLTEFLEARGRGLEAAAAGALNPVPEASPESGYPNAAAGAPAGWSESGVVSARALVATGRLGSF